MRRVEASGFQSLLTQFPNLLPVCMRGEINNLWCSVSKMGEQTTCLHPEELLVYYAFLHKNQSGCNSSKDRLEKIH